MLQAQNYINAVIEEQNALNPNARIPSTGGHFVTLHKFRVGEKIQALFKRAGGAAEIQVGLVLDSNDAKRNCEAAKHYREKLAIDIESGRIEDVRTASGANVGLLRRFKTADAGSLQELAKQVIAEASRIRSRLGEL